MHDDQACAVGKALGRTDVAEQDDRYGKGMDMMVAPRGSRGGLVTYLCMYLVASVAGSPWREGFCSFILSKYLSRYLSAIRSMAGMVRENGVV